MTIFDNDDDKNYTPAGLLLKTIYYWIDRNKKGGFDNNLSYTENLDLIINNYQKLITDLKKEENDD
jgi:hypothetical protein